ncbi:MAG TPA: aminotransferase class I/II-fold pyridoxal phosphate-dependent enzyme [Paucimonas sp.]|nr:aminotransferase class I/II-fold pyridoxal phosphate-dependent enzyme [Paucimonas sp.]
MKARGEDVIDLSIAISNYPAPKAVVERTIEELRKARLPYTEVVGAGRVRNLLVRKLRAENHIEARPEEVIVTNGAKQAVYEALYSVTDPGDSIIIFKPHWPAYVAISELLGLRPILVDLPEQISAATLDAFPKAKVIVVNNPHNPMGKVFTKSELLAIKEWTIANGAYAICDESYEKLIFEGEHISLASLGDWREPGVITVFSASQSYAMMGWRVGFAVAPARVIEAMQTLQGPITAAASAITQAATEAAFAEGDPVEMMNDYRERRDVVVDMFQGIPWMKMHKPAAGPYLWGDISALTMDTVGFVEGLLEQEKIAVMPGEALGVAGCIRVNFISDDVDVLRRAAAGIIRFGDNFARSKR